MTYRTPTEGKFWAQSENHRIAYAAHGVKATMGKRGANPIVRPALYAIQRALLDPVERFDWGTWFTKHHYQRVAKSGLDLHAGAFIALEPADPQIMTIAGGTPAEDLHCTLVYLGEAVSLSQETKRKVLMAVRAWAAVGTKLQATVSSFGPLGDAALVAHLDAPELVARREQLVALLRSLGVEPDMTFPDFKPHVTLAYSPAFSPLAANSVLVAPVYFDRVQVAFGSAVRRVYSLQGEPVFKAASDPLQVGSLDPIIEGFKKKAKPKVDQAIKDLHQDAAAHVVAQLNLPHAPEDLQAGIDETFQRYSTGVTDNAADELRTVLEDTLAEGWGSPAEFSKELRSRWDTFSKDQADTIAWTEYNTVASQATLSSYRANGVEYKAWMTVGDGDVCDECQGNEDEGPIPIDQEFSSGDDAPPQHPNCRCNVTSVVSPDSALSSDYSDLPELQKYDDSEERDERGRWTAGLGTPVASMAAVDPRKQALWVTRDGKAYASHSHEEALGALGKTFEDSSAQGLLRLSGLGNAVEFTALPSDQQRAWIDQFEQRVGVKDWAHMETHDFGPALAVGSDYKSLETYLSGERTISKYDDSEARDDHGRWTGDAMTADGSRAEKSLHDHFGFDVVSAETAATTPYFRGVITQGGRIYGDISETPHGELYQQVSAKSGVAPEKMGMQSITNTGETGSGKDEMMLAVGGRITASQLGTIRSLFALNRGMQYDLYDRGWVDSRSGQGATQFNAHLKELGRVEKSGWSRLVQFMKGMGGGAGIGTTEGTFTTGDLSVGGGLLAPRQGLPRKPKKTDPAAPQPVHGVDDKYWNLEQDPISGEYKVRQGTRR